MSSHACRSLLVLLDVVPPGDHPSSFDPVTGIDDALSRVIFRLGLAYHRVGDELKRLARGKAERSERQDTVSFVAEVLEQSAGSAPRHARLVDNHKFWKTVV
jgi:hypothetical protein